MPVALPFLAALLLLTPAVALAGPEAVAAGGRAAVGLRGAAAFAPFVPPDLRHSGRLAVPRPGETAYGWPLTPARVVRRFDPPPQPWLAGHRGADLAGSPAAIVRSAGAGTVVFAGIVAGRGVVSVAHAGGLRTTYEPVSATVAAGAHVARGDPLGVLEAGHPGCPVEACLHWGLRRGNLYFDPLALLGLGRVRLLPLGDQR